MEIEVTVEVIFTIIETNTTMVMITLEVHSVTIAMGLDTWVEIVEEVRMAIIVTRAMGKHKLKIKPHRFALHVGAISIFLEIVHKKTRRGDRLFQAGRTRG